MNAFRSSLRRFPPTSTLPRGAPAFVFWGVGFVGRFPPGISRGLLKCGRPWSAPMIPSPTRSARSRPGNRISPTLHPSTTRAMLVGCGQGEDGTGFYRFLCLGSSRSATVSGWPRTSPCPFFQVHSGEWNPARVVNSLYASALFRFQQSFLRAEIRACRPHGPRRWRSSRQSWTRRLRRRHQRRLRAPGR